MVLLPRGQIHLEVHLLEEEVREQEELPAEPYKCLLEVEVALEVGLEEHCHFSGAQLLQNAGL